jgi:two-component system chemotaxis response regulator CheB
MSIPAARSDEPSAAPAQRAKVLIVDDSVVARGLLSRWIGEHPSFEVVASVSDGAAGVKAAAQHKPKIVILDLDMPVMDGLTALPEILKASPDSSVIVASSLTARSARLSMQCLALGAVDLQPKPDTNRDLTMSTSFRQELMRKVEGLLGARPSAPTAARPAIKPVVSREMLTEPTRAPLPTTLAPLRAEVAPRLIAIGSSTGGPRAVAQVLHDMGPAISRLPIVIAQHMPPVFTASFAEQLGVRTGRPAREAIHGETPVPGSIYVAPGGRHLRLDKSEGVVRLKLDDSAPVKFCRPSVDILFNDAALVFGAATLAVILTGMGNDGADGAKLLRQAGAPVLAQDEATSVVWGMPGAVARAGLASRVLPLNEIGAAMAQLMLGGARP